MKLLKTSAIVFIVTAVSVSQEINITGVVTDPSGTGIPDVAVKLQKGNLADTTESDGRFAITNSSNLRNDNRRAAQSTINQIGLRNGQLIIQALPNTPICVEMFNASGGLLFQRKYFNTSNQTQIRLPMNIGQVVLFDISIGERRFRFRTISLEKATAVIRQTTQEAKASLLSKQAAASPLTADVVLAKKNEYADKSVFLTNLDTADIAIRMFPGAVTANKSIGSAGGILEYASGDSAIALSIPPDALQESYNFSISTVNSNDSIFGGMTFELCPTGISFAQPATISFRCDSSLVNGEERAKLRIVTTSDTAWSLVTTEIDTQTQTISGPINHLCRFNWLMGKTAVSGKITDGCARPLSGISVLCEGLDNGRSAPMPSGKTDANGRYEIVVKGYSQYLMYPAYPNGEKWEPKQYQFDENDDGNSEYDFQLQDNQECCFQYEFNVNCWGHHSFKYSPSKGFFDHSITTGPCGCDPNGCIKTYVTLSGDDPFAPTFNADGWYFTFHFDSNYEGVNWTGWNNAPYTGPPDSQWGGTMSPIGCE